MSAPNLSDNNSDTAWRSLHVYNIYRLVLSGLLGVVFFSGSGTNLLGKENPTAFGIIVLTYIAISFISGFASRLRFPPFEVQAFSAILFDIILLTLLMHTSGGAKSGLGILIIVSIASSGVLMGGKLAFTLAAVAALTILGQQAYTIFFLHSGTTQEYTQSGLIGASCFAIVSLTHVLTRRMRVSEELAIQKTQEVADLTRLNELVMQQIDTGFIITDAYGKVRFMNNPARHMLNIKTIEEGAALQSISAEIFNRLFDWQRSTYSEIPPFRSSGSDREILPKFSQLPGSTGMSTLITLEDTAQLAQQTQQIKLASLGRLTASIAHEIRNPLSAISHAGQLLAESEHIIDQDRRLTDIIGKQSQRMDTIVENILSLSKKREFSAEEIDLNNWVKQYVTSLIQDMDLSATDISVVTSKQPAISAIDPTHLAQIMNNLCENGIRYSRAAGASSLLLTVKISLDSTRVLIDVIDEGRGVEESDIDKLFEPFFTTDASGTGLGLYIARELGELNHAHLSYIHEHNQGAQFRLSMPIVDRKS